MKPSSVFDFTDYRKYLDWALPTSGSQRGSRVQLAQHLGCQNGFISLVIHRRAQFSLEHAVKVTEFLHHGPEERDYFFLLIQLGRAGSKGLEDYFREKVEKVQEQRKQIYERIGQPKLIHDVVKQDYYSSWHFIAVHMCLMIPKLQDPQSISDYLGVPVQRVNQIVEFFLVNGFAKRDQGRIIGIPTRIHLPSDSPLLPKHHTNWRFRAVSALDSTSKESLHYSSVMSVSGSTLEQIRALLLRCIQESEPFIRDAADERVCAMNIDLFEVGNGI